MVTFPWRPTTPVTPTATAACWPYSVPRTGGGTSTTVQAAVHYGTSGDIPVPGHYAGTSANGYADDLAVFRPSTGIWYIDGLPTVHYGEAGDIPVPADYNGDGTTDIAVYRPSTHIFYVRGQTRVGWGLDGDIPVTDDFNGDGMADFVVYRPSNHTWYTHGGASVKFGGSGVVPVGAGPVSRLTCPDALTAALVLNSDFHAILRRFKCATSKLSEGRCVISGMTSESSIETSVAPSCALVSALATADVSAVVR